MGPLHCYVFFSLAIVAKLSFSPYLPNSPLSPTFMGPLHCFVLCLVGDCGKIVIFAILPNFAALANFYGPPSLLCALPRCQLWENCHFRHIAKFCCFGQLLWAPFTALCFSLLAIVAKLSFSPYLPNSPLLPTFMGPLHYFVFFLVGDCGKIVIFAIFNKFATLANFYGPPSMLCALPHWRLWQNCHFRHICQIRRFHQLLWASAIVAKLSFSPCLPNSPLSPTFMGPLHCFVVCLVGDCGKIVIFAIFAKFAAFANFYGPPSLLCVFLVGNCAKIVIFAIFAKFAAFVNFYGSPSLLCVFLVGDCGKIVIFAIFTKFAAFINFYGSPSLLCVFPRWRLWQNCHFRHICQIRRFRQLLWAPFTALCFSLLAIVAKLSFSSYLPNSPLSSTFMGPLHCFVFFLVGDCGKIVIFAIFAKFVAFVNFYGSLSLLCVFPRWRLWQNCHFCHICQIRQYFLIFAIFVVVCISGHISEREWTLKAPLFQLLVLISAVNVSKNIE